MKYLQHILPVKSMILHRNLIGKNAQMLKFNQKLVKSLE